MNIGLLPTNEIGAPDPKVTSLPIYKKGNTYLLRPEPQIARLEQ